MVKNVRKDEENVEWIEIYIQSKELEEEKKSLSTVKR
jgi:hypothetical protein